MTDKNVYAYGERMLTRRSFLAGSVLVPATMGVTSAWSAVAGEMSFGIVTDIHYAQMYSDGIRYYTGLYDKLQGAIDEFNAQDVDFIVELGDFIHSGGERGDEIDHLEEINNVYRSFSKDCYYVLGNHDLQLLTKKEFLRYVDQPMGQYSFDVKGFHFIVMDTCFSPDGAEYKKGRFDWTKSFMPKSGLSWLTDDLKSAANRPVIVFTHQTLHNDGFRHCVVNAPEIRAAFESHGDVRAVFQGHMHFNQHVVVGGIHYITLSAMVNGRTRESNPYGIVRLDNTGSVVFDGYSQRDYTWDPSEIWIPTDFSYSRRR